MGIANLLAYIAEDFGVGIAAVAVIASSLSLGQAVGSVVWGGLVDKIGLRKTFSVATMLIGVFSIIFGLFSATLLLACVFVFLVGFSTSGVSPSTVPKLISVWFAPNMRGRGIIPITMGGTLAGVITGIAVPWMISTFAGWGASYVAMGVIDLVFALFVFAVIRDSPAEKGLMPCGYSKALEVVAEDDKPEGEPSLFQNIAKGAKLKNAWLLGLIALLGAVYLSGCMNNTVAALLESGVDGVSAGLCMSIFSAAMCISQIVFPIMSDKVSTKTVLSIMFIGFVAGGALMWYCYSAGASTAVFFGMCAFAGLFFGTNPIINIQSSSLFPVHLRGAGAGIVYLCLTIGNVIGPLLVGAIIGATGQAFGFVYSCIACGVLSIVLAQLLPRTGGKYGDPFLNADGTVKKLDEVVLKR